MDDNILPRADEFSYTDDPTEEINTVFRRKSLETGKDITELAFGDKYQK